MQRSLSNFLWRYATRGGLATIEEGRERLYNPLPLFHLNAGIVARIAAGRELSAERVRELQFYEGWNLTNPEAAEILRRFTTPWRYGWEALEQPAEATPAWSRSGSAASSSRSPGSRRRCRSLVRRTSPARR